MARLTLIPGDKTQVEISMQELKRTVKFLYENNLCSHDSVQNMLGLLGGWAVHFYVDKFFQEGFGKPYLGSLDIDIFVHCDPERLRKLSKDGIDRLGFTHVHSHRHLKIFKRDIDEDTFENISIKDAANIPQYQLVNLYLDLYCDNTCVSKDPVCRKFNAWPQTLLQFAFKGDHTIKLMGDNKILLPSIPLLIMLKSESLIDDGRNIDKLRKDFCDLTALFLLPETQTLLKNSKLEGLKKRLSYIWDNISKLKNLKDTSLILFNNPDTTFLNTHLKHVVLTLEDNGNCEQMELVK